MEGKGKSFRPLNVTTTELNVDIQADTDTTLTPAVGPQAALQDDTVINANCQTDTGNTLPPTVRPKWTYGTPPDNGFRQLEDKN